MNTVMIPGLACSARLYEPVLSDVWAHGPVTIADTRRDDTIPAMAERLLRGAPERFALAGLSMGGYVALEVVRQAPERVQALALLCTSARPDTPEQSAARREQIALARAGRLEELVDLAFPVLVDAAHQDRADLRAVGRQMAMEVGPEAFCAQQEAIIQRADARPLLTSIAVPAAVIHGAGDQLIPVEAARESAAALPDADLTVIDGAGHMAMHERTDAVRAALLAWLERAAAV